MWTAAVDLGDLRWLAGFLEGEGSFIMTKKGKGQVDRDPRLIANQKQRWPLDKILSIVKFGSIQYSKSRNIYFYSLSCNKAIQWMMTLYQLMSPRRKEQIENVISLWKNRPGRGFRNKIKTHCPKGHEYSKENTIVSLRRSGKTCRICRTCMKEHKARYYKLSKELRIDEG